MEPITTVEFMATGYERKERKWTYEDILKYFDNHEGSLVVQLTKRCQELEKIIKDLKKEKL